MQQRRITTTDAPHFEQAWDLYLAAFPADERRCLDFQKMVLCDDAYHFDILTENDHFVGFVLWWEFEKILYIEHFATLPALRGKGIGRQVLADFFTKDNKKTVLLEVEKPEEEIQVRRINFYQRLGLKLNVHTYFQPSYSVGGTDVELLIMTYPIEISADELDDFCKTCHPIIHAATLNKK